MAANGGAEHGGFQKRPKTPEWKGIERLNPQNNDVGEAPGTKERVSMDEGGAQQGGVEHTTRG